MSMKGERYMFFLYPIQCSIGWLNVYEGNEKSILWIVHTGLYLLNVTIYGRFHIYGVKRYRVIDHHHLRCGQNNFMMRIPDFYEIQ